MSAPDAVEQELARILAEELDLKIERARITPTAPLFEGGLGLDSIALVELIGLVEENFNVFFEDDELTMETFQDLRTLAKLVRARQASTPHS
ncbi:MAG: acyl carrier protein [Alphaproteobacteria bacterium]|nr:acyl carrier protein [Alphaproteobacteria bacterium]